jgi:hypothetical protein
MPDQQTPNQTKRSRGRPPRLMPHHLTRFLELRGTGMSAIRAASLIGFHRNTLSRKLRDDPFLLDANTLARDAGKQIQEETRMATNTTTTTPAEELAALSLQRAHEALDAEEGKPGAAARLAAIEQRIKEVNVQVERAALVEAERQRRAAEAAERERERQRADLQAKLKKVEAERTDAYKALEKDLDAVVASVIRATDLAAQCDATNVALQRARGDEDFTGAAGYAMSPVSNRVLHRLGRDAGLNDIRVFPGLGAEPLR